jgi:hypothetical protein
MDDRRRWSTRFRAIPVFSPLVDRVCGQRMYVRIGKAEPFRGSGFSLTRAQHNDAA